ncbi:hypothetical protein KEM48_011095 [Puccinia striiformis f. sp. tritici PST-130]|nr:hypothetical protein KEM48_011095 [Puccinia striiformis f. sp. tritici PST-130]
MMGFLKSDLSCQLKQAILVNEANDLLALVKNPPESQLYPKKFHGPKFELGLHDKTWELQLFQSSAFVKWLNLITTCIPTSHNVIPRRFRPGLDYTLATSNEEQLLEVHMSLTPSLGWRTVKCDEDQSDPAVYKGAGPTEAGEDDDDSTLLTIHPSWNKLDLVLRDPQILTFTKYVSSKSPHSKWDVKAAYKLKEDEED